MPTFENPAVEAGEAPSALRAPAHATRSLDDPHQIYSVLGSLTWAVESLSQSHHELTVSAYDDTVSLRHPSHVKGRFGASGDHGPSPRVWWRVLTS